MKAEKKARKIRELESKKL